MAWSPLSDVPSPRREPADASACAADDEIVLGWECAAPALQVEGWAAEADRDPASGFH
ncbi:MULTISPECIES: hypothetical protein [Ramlibacter]|uniref:Uncharacterized protein n=1 Tax=Ramlibacter aquaticus TaxID=2780094 RepID=A0ABR9S9I7_9BURK|nr:MULTISPECIES: hypothetical protein [Ramlibacter]MBE7939012.1 hypothetical protein [Ramlibacter aquaticus]